MRRKRWFPLLILWLAAGMRLWHLDATSLWLDEITTQWYAKKSYAEMLRILTHYDDHPPLMYSIAILQHTLLGSTDFAARLPWAFAGILGVALMFPLASRYLKSRNAAVLAALFLTLAPMHIRYSQEARQYTLLLTFSLATLYFFHRGLTHPSPAAWLGYVLSTVGNIYTHNIALIWLFVQGCILLFLLPLRRRYSSIRSLALFFLTAWGITGILYLPWLPHMLVQKQRLQAHVSYHLPSWSQGHQVLVKVFRAFTNGDRFLLGGILFLAFWGLVFIVRHRRWNEGVILLLTLILFPTISIMVQAQHFFAARYLIPLLGPLLLLTTAGFWELYHWITRWPHFHSHPRLVVSVLGVIFLLPFLRADMMYYRETKEDWRGVAHYIARHTSDNTFILGDGAIYGRGGDARRVDWCLGYYLGDLARILRVQPGISSLLPEPDTQGRVWGVFWHQSSLRHRAQVEKVVRIIDFKDIAVFELKQPTGYVWPDTARLLEIFVTLHQDPRARLDARLALAEVYKGLGRSDAALEQLLLASDELAPGDEAGARRITQVASRLSLIDQLQKARTVQPGDGVEEARKAYRDAVERADTPSKRYAMLMKWGIWERTQGDPAVAVSVFARALRLRPKDLEAQRHYCAALVEAHQNAQAVHACENLLSLSPRDFWGLYFLGRAYTALGDTRQAWDAFTRALAVANSDQKRGMALVGAVKVAVTEHKCAEGARIYQDNKPLPPLYDRTVRQLLKACSP